jgi:hypothetical protein
MPFPNAADIDDLLARLEAAPARYAERCAASMRRR